MGPPSSSWWPQRSCGHMLLALALLCASSAAHAAAADSAAAGSTAAAGASSSGSTTAAGALPVDVVTANFTQIFKPLAPQAEVVVEFYASWCPHCRAFKPHYERVAAYCAASTPIRAYRVDCAVDPELCRKFNIMGYPTILAGNASDVLAANYTRLSDYDSDEPSGKAGGKRQHRKRGAPDVVAWLGDVFGRKLELPADAPPPGKRSGSRASGPKQQQQQQQNDPQSPVQWRELDAAGATWELVDQIAVAVPHNQETRAAFKRLLELWEQAHPVARCRIGAYASLQRLDATWPARSPTEPTAAAVQKLQPCEVPLGPEPRPAFANPPPGHAHTDSLGGGRKGDGASGGGGDGGAAVGEGGERLVPQWSVCKGSTTKPESRGFTCGLWLLFHATAARLPEDAGGKLMMSALGGFGRHFFLCKVCQKHFLGMVGRPEASAVVTRSDMVKWLWRAHNEVNKRLAHVEAEYGYWGNAGDPEVFKTQWPRETACPQCRKQPAASAAAAAAGAAAAGSGSGNRTVEWDEGEVMKYLEIAYAGEAPDAGSSAAPGGGLGDLAGGWAVWLAAAGAAAMAAHVARRRHRQVHGSSKTL